MPVVHSYKHHPGLYLRSHIDEQFVTFQVNDEAGEFILDLGYQDGDTIGWTIIHPLWEKNFVYTHKSGLDHTPDSVKPTEELSVREQNLLDNFLAESEQEQNQYRHPDTLDIGNTLHSGDRFWTTVIRTTRKGAALLKNPTFRDKTEYIRVPVPDYFEYKKHGATVKLMNSNELIFIELVERGYGEVVPTDEWPIEHVDEHDRLPAHLQT